MIASPLDTIASDSQAGHPSGFEPLHPAVIRRLNCCDVDLYVLGGDEKKPLLLRDSKLRVQDQRIDRLLETADRRVLVRQEDFARLSAELLKQIDTIPEDPTLSSADRFALLQTAVAAEMEHAATLLQPNRLVDFVKRISGYFVKLVSSTELTVRDLFGVARHDHSAYSHATNVCCYSLLLAEQLGVSCQQQLDELAVGALVHNCGMRIVPQQILDKPGRLTAKEMKIVRQHPQYGYERLVCFSDLTLPQLLMVYQHHERIDGGGYPVGAIGEDIHPWARLLTVVEVFDALTGRRPYRSPMRPEEAMKHINVRSGSHFESEVVQCWQRLLQTT